MITQTRVYANVSESSNRVIRMNTNINRYPWRMNDTGGSCTLIFHRVQSFNTEHIVNSIAAFATRSNFAHVELAIGTDSNQTNQITNVCRIFNDHVGAELTQRTGRNPSFVYLQLGCSRAQEQQMLRFAQSTIGRPFSTTAMIRSITSCPRKSTGQSYFCAELVASVLKEGGLMDKSSNPGSATPESLYRLYSKHAAATGNPFTLRCIAEQAQQEHLEMMGLGLTTHTDGISRLSLHRTGPVKASKSGRFQSLRLNPV